MNKIDTPRLTKALQSGDKSAAQLLEIAANEIASGDLRDLLIGSAKLIRRTREQLTEKLVESV